MTGTATSGGGTKNLEGHPRTCKWFGSSPCFFAIKFGHLECEESDRSLGEKNEKTMSKFTTETIPGMILQVGVSDIVVPQNGWFIKWMIWGYPYFRKLLGREGKVVDWAIIQGRELHRRRCKVS